MAFGIDDVLLGGALSGAGSAVGGIFGKADPPPKPTATFLPNTDPLLAALSGEGLLGLGQFDPSILENASPVKNLTSQILSLPSGVASEAEKQRSLALLDKAQSMGLFTQFAQAVEAGFYSPDIDSMLTFMINAPNFVYGEEELAFLKSEEQGHKDFDITDASGREVLSSAKIGALGGDRAKNDQFKSFMKLGTMLGRLGVNVGELSANQARFEIETPKLQAKQEALAKEVLEGRMDAQRATAEIQSDISRIAGGDFGQINQIPFVEGMRSQIDLDRQRAERDIFARSDRAGSNPGASLRAIDEQAFNLNNQIPQNATGMLLNVLSALQASTQIGFENANTASAARSQEKLAAAQIAANQQAAFTNAAAQTNLNNADNLGGGIAGAFGALGDAALLSRFTGGRGPGGVTSPNLTAPDISGLTNFDPNSLDFP